MGCWKKNEKTEIQSCQCHFPGRSKIQIKRKSSNSALDKIFDDGFTISHDSEQTIFIPVLVETKLDKGYDSCMDQTNAVSGTQLKNSIYVVLGAKRPILIMVRQVSSFK